MGNKGQFVDLGIDAQGWQNKALKEYITLVYVLAQQKNFEQLFKQM